MEGSYPIAQSFSLSLVSPSETTRHDSGPLSQRLWTPVHTSANPHSHQARASQVEKNCVGTDALANCWAHASSPREGCCSAPVGSALQRRWMCVIRSSVLPRNLGILHLYVKVGTQCPSFILTADQSPSGLNEACWSQVICYFCEVSGSQSPEVPSPQRLWSIGDNTV